MELVALPITRQVLVVMVPLLLLWIGGCGEAENRSTSASSVSFQLSSELESAQPVSTERYLKRTVGDAFGAAVAISADGQILAIGAPGEDNIRQEGASHREMVNAGTVYLYHHRAGSWSPLARVQAGDGESDDRFGSRLSLSADGSLLVVAAPFKDHPDRSQSSLNAGVAYVYRRHQQGWQQEAQLRANNADGFDEFGSALAISADGQTIAISAPGEDGRSDQNASDNQLINAGAVYLFRYQNDQWQQTTRLKADQAGLMDNFGSAISLSADGRVLAVGADRHDGAINHERRSNSGAVYLFEQRQAQWEFTAKLQSRHADANDNFGAALSLSKDGHRLAVGAPGEAGTSVLLDETDNQAPNAGAVFIFERDAEGWQQLAYVKAPYGEANDGFGSQLQMSSEGQHLAVGAPWEDGALYGYGEEPTTNNDALQAGSVYLFDGTGSDWRSVATLKADNIAAFDHFGKALAMTDSGQQLVVGVASEDAGWVEGLLGYQRGAALGAGAAYVFRQQRLIWQQQQYLKSAMHMEHQLAQN